MNEARILQLKQFLKEDENDHFSQYALALEHKEELPHEAIKYLEELKKKAPAYTALYYHLAELYVDTDQVDSARATYLAGIAVLEKSDEPHALKELRNAYQNFIFEYD